MTGRAYNNNSSVPFGQQGKDISILSDGILDAIVKGDWDAVQGYGQSQIDSAVEKGKTAASSAIDKEIGKQIDTATEKVFSSKSSTDTPTEVVLPKLPPATTMQTEDKSNNTIKIAGAGVVVAGGTYFFTKKPIISLIAGLAAGGATAYLTQEKTQSAK